MKKIIRAIELYPIYSLRDMDEDLDSKDTIEVSPELYERWIEARKEFNAVQNEFRKLISPNLLVKL